MGGALLILAAAAVFFSTPWLGEAAPHYLPMPGIQLELNTTPSHFMHTLSVIAHNVDDSQTQFCAPYPELEYYDNGEWHRLHCDPYRITAACAGGERRVFQELVRGPGGRR